MKFFAIFNALAFTSSAIAINLAWDTNYDSPNASLTTVACSNGDNGLITRFNFSTFSDLPTFPFIGAAPNIAGFNSPNCGTCFLLNFTNSTGTHSIHFTGIDVGVNSFVTGQNALNSLTNGQAEQLGVIPVNMTIVNATGCGL
ncbi:hypothetical protein VNI00_011038 [Paramarasmius palmivorus]|uniref:SnodProt1 n=1 Tax=Paramarasmius palmivorus TaxID=297713 RepID=A0AAW0CHP3_9AGAR